MTTNREVLESGRKRARTEEASCSSSSSSALAVLACNKTIGLTPKAFSSTTLRASLISDKLSALLKEFPEMNFIFGFENLQVIAETAVVKYVEEREAKNMIHEAQVLMNYGQEISSLYYLPDEVLNKCLSYVGKGHYGSVALVSKKLNQAYKKMFGNETAYLEMATSVKLANHCLGNLCKSSNEKDEILKAAAVNGNLDILRAPVKDGYDLFPLVAMNIQTIYTENDSHYHIYHTDIDERKSNERPLTVNLAKLVERGHLHVLKYLHEELHYFLGLQRYCKPAIEHGKLEILQWLDDIDCLENGGLRIGQRDNRNFHNDIDYCECAIKSGRVEILDWLLKTGSYCINNRTSDKYVLADAIESKSIEMIQYCFNLGYDNLNNGWVEYAMKKTKSVKVFRKMHELGYEFSVMWMWIERNRIEEYFEVIKFLRSISVPWDDGFMNNILENHCSLEIIQYAHEHGCPWTGKELGILLRRSRMSQSWNVDKFKYLINSGCTITHEKSSNLIYEIKAKRDIEVLKYFVGKNSIFDNMLCKEIVEYGELWSEGLSHLLKRGKDIQIIKSIEEVFRHREFSMERIRFFYDLGLPWCLDSSRNTHLLSRIACFNDLDHVKWAYENGCKGGKLVPYVEEEWKERGLRHEKKWKENQAFFEENGLLDECFLEKNWVKKLDPENVQEIGDAQLSLYYSREGAFFRSSNRSWDGYNDDDEEDEIVDTGKITSRDNLHVLHYLKDQFESYTWLQKYCQSAIEHGQLEILKWLHSIGCLHEIDIFGTNNDFCLCAISSGQLDVLNWLHGLGFEECEKYIHYAIESKSMEMIEFCLDMLGHFDLNNDETNKALAKAKSIELYRFFHGLGHRLTMDAINDLTYTDKEILTTAEDFEIIKFLRSVGVEWNRYIMTDIVSRGSLEMIQFAHEDGCPWCVLNYSEIYYLLSSGKEKYCSQKLKYLVDNGCPFDDDGSKRASLTLKACWELRELSALECLVGKYSRFDNALLKELLSNYKSHHTYGPLKDKPWLEGIKLVFEKGKEIYCFDTIDDVFDVLPNIELVKHLRERLKLPWTSNDLNKYILLSKIACHHGIEGVQWAFDNGLGYDNPSLKCLNQKSDDTNDVCKLIIERGFIFPSRLEKREVIEKAFMECCKHPSEEKRSSLVSLRKIPVCGIN